MEQQMMEAARDGDISALYALNRQDSNLLVETPLHIAASHGKTQFALEMMVLKPSFVLKLNQDGLTPLHLAVQQGHTDTALGLLNNSASGGGGGDQGDIVRVRGKGGLTPLHCAAEKGNIELLLKFLSVSPRSMEDVTIRNETALHIALNNRQLDALTILLGWVELASEEGPFWEERFLNIKDHQGNTILDLATSNQLFQVVSLVANSRLAKYVDFSTANIPPPQNSEPPMSFLNDFTPLLSTDKRLNKAAYDGDTDALYAILWEDRSVLDRIDIASFVDTPLHIATSKGHTRFAKEIIKLKPSFATKLNQDGFSPLHLAVQNQKLETAVELVSMNIKLVSVKGKDDMTPSLLYPDNNKFSATVISQLLVLGNTVLQGLAWPIFAALNTITFAVSLSHICYMLPNKHFLFLPLACWVLCYSIALYIISSGVVVPVTLSTILFWWLDTPFNTVTLFQNQKISRLMVATLVI